MIDLDALFGGESEDDRVKQDRMRRYRADMERARGYGQPSGMGGVMARADAAKAEIRASAEGMADKTMAAWNREHDSRLAQLREMRRMEHEKELMRMRLASQQQEQEGAIIRSLLNG